jgi:3-hydroxybutyryl-CoA dehydratase
MAKQINIAALREGMEIPGLKKEIIQQNINTYAEASRDFNPVHINEEFAKKTPLGGTVAHGMLILVYISEMMTAAFGGNWISGGKLNVRFRSAARPGDTITVSGTITKLEKSGQQTIIHCSVLCSNQKGEQVITGEAILTV